jgi:mannosyltransferase
LIAAVAFSIKLNGAELWRDELFSISVAVKSPSDILHTIGHTGDSYTFYYLVLHFWGAMVGYSAAALRALSVIAMTCAVYCVYRTGCVLGGSRTAGVVAGLLMVAVPEVDRMAQEVRPYALVLAGVSAANLIVLGALWPTGRPHRPERVAACYLVTITLIAYLNLVAVAMLAGHAAVLVIRWWSGRDRKLCYWLAAAAGGAVVLAVPFAMLSWGATTAFSRGHRPRLAQLFPGSGFGSNRVWFWATAMGSTGVAVTLFVLILIALPWRGTVVARARALALVFVIPVIAVWLVSQGGTSFFSPRHLLFTVPALFAAAALGVIRVLEIFPACNRTVLSIAVVYAIVLAGLAGQVHFRTPGGHDDSRYPAADEGSERVGGYIDYRGGAELIARRMRAGDAIGYSSRGDKDFEMLNFGIAYFWPRNLPRPVDIFASGTGPGGVFVTETPDDDTVAAAGPCTLWFVTAGHVQAFDSVPYLGTKVPPAKSAAIRANYATIDRSEVPGLSIFHTVKPICTADSRR